MFKLDLERPWDVLQMVWFWVERSKVNVMIRVNGVGLNSMSVFYLGFWFRGAQPGYLCGIHGQL